MILDGHVEGRRDRARVGSGWLASITGTARWFGGGDGEPFFLTTLSVGTSRARTTLTATDEQEPLSATDVRIGAHLGITAFEHWNPYLVARAFGGPVRWRDQTGSDRHHYAIGFGASTSVGSHFNLSFDTTFIGEQAVSWGAGLSF